MGGESSVCGDVGVSGRLRVEWLAFLEGRWQKELPNQAGLYFRRTRDGFPGGTDLVYQDPHTREYRSVHSWGGDWWSKPIPDLPGLDLS